MTEKSWPTIGIFISFCASYDMFQLFLNQPLPLLNFQEGSRAILGLFEGRALAGPGSTSSESSSAKYIKIVSVKVLELLKASVVLSMFRFTQPASTCNHIVALYHVYLNL